MIGAMQLHASSEEVACSGCLALMALLRAEGAGSPAVQGRLGRAGAVGTLVAAMDRFQELAVVQLSVMLALIPLAMGALRVYGSGFLSKT